MRRRTPRPGLAARSAILVLLAAAFNFAVHILLPHLLPGASPTALAVTAALVSAVVLVVLMRRLVTHDVRQTMQAVSDGLLALTEGDHGLRLVCDRDDEAGRLLGRFNTLAEKLRGQHSDAYQRELLLDVVLGASNMAAVICTETGRIIYGNLAARQLLYAGKKLEGNELGEALSAAPAELRAAVNAGSDGLCSVERPGSDGPETYHVSRHVFTLSTQAHVLVLIKPLTRELVRKEIDTWKKAIRVISHEVNNSLAPISSLIHSMRLLVQSPGQSQRLGKALDTIEERATHLKTFLDGYASFARLPMPSKRGVTWRELLAGVEGLYAFRVVGELPAAPVQVDPGQMQQVLINLLKNAHEAGGDADAVTVSVAAGERFTTLAIADRGKGMTDEQLHNAVLPFYSTKKSGTGLGLALCREIVEAHGGILSLQRNVDAGITVSCRVP
jgi:nitrogen fixation/metabolism regulation signal transduction histidine kinase